MPARGTTHRVVVVDGGYAGTLAANRLRKRDDVAVTLLNPRPTFIDRIRLHQFVAGTGTATADYGSLLAEGIELVVDHAARIDTAARTVRLASGGDLDYDYLIYAVGSAAAIPASTPGAAENAVSMVEWESAQRLRATLGELRRVTIWAAGFGVPELAAASGLRTDEIGRLLTDETLTSVDDDRIVATGDAAAPSGQPLRMTCQAAGPLGAQAADTVLCRIAGTEPPVIDFAFTGACVSLGRRSGVRQFARKDDTAVNVYVGGRIGAAVKELTCKVVLLAIRREARKPGSRPWPKGGPRPEQPVPDGIRAEAS